MTYSGHDMIKSDQVHNNFKCHIRIKDKNQQNKIKIKKLGSV